MFNSDGYEIAVLDKLFERFADSITKTDCIKLGQVLLDDSVSNEMKITLHIYPPKLILELLLITFLNKN